MEDQIAQLERVLSQIQLLEPPYRDSQEGKQIFQRICELVLEDHLYRHLWSEPTLNQLEDVFQTRKPDEQLFGAELEEIRKRAIDVREVNDFFFAILEPSITVNELCGLLSKIQRLSEEFCGRLESSGRLQEIRAEDGNSSKKVGRFLEFMKDDLELDLTEKEIIKEVLTSLKSHETVGKVNALLVRGNGKAILVPLHVKIQSGSGQVQCQIKGSEDFKDAVVRAQSAMWERGFISESDDVLYTLDLTDSQYQGSSLSLAAAMAMYDAKLNVASDPYTSFTGAITLVGQDWTITAVSSVEQKIAAAKQAGCRRVFISSANSADASASPNVKVHGVDSLIDTFIQLRPSLPLLPGNSLQGRKVRAIQEYCHTQGWDLPAFEPIQAGLQCSIVPLEIPAIKIQIYKSGAHTPNPAVKGNMRSFWRYLIRLTNRLFRFEASMNL